MKTAQSELQRQTGTERHTSGLQPKGLHMVTRVLVHQGTSTAECARVLVRQSSIAEYYYSRVLVEQSPCTAEY